MWYLLLVFYIIFQIAAQLAMKYGSLKHETEMIGLIFGNVFGISSNIFMTMAYKHININSALCILGGTSFIIVQIVIAVVFKSVLSPIQWLGIVLMTGGIFIFSFSGEIKN